MSRMQPEIGGVPGVQIAVRPMLMGHMVSPLGSQRDLDTLNRVEQEQAELSIEDVQVKYVVKTGLCFESVSAVVCFKGQPIAGQAVIVDVGQIMTGLRSEEHTSEL